MAKPVRVGADVALANGKTWKTLQDEAKKAIASGVDYWPRIVLQLLDRYNEVAKRNQDLAQGDLFSPPPLRRPEERYMITEKGRAALARSHDEK